MQKYVVDCVDGILRIEITYWFNETGLCNGEVYFRNTDLCADMRDGTFFYPMNNTEYTFHAPRQPLKSEYAILLVNRPVMIDQQIPRKVS